MITTLTTLIFFLVSLTFTLSITITSIHDAVEAYMTLGDSSQYGPIASWDTSSVTDMSGLFFDYYALKFNAFNADLSSWDTSNVTNMNYMFYRAEEFNSDISQWDVAKVTDMAGMFSNSLAFNQNIQAWDVRNVQDMYQMFLNAASFNQNLSPWNIGKVRDMTKMFESTAMDQSLCWDLKDVQDTTDMLAYTKIQFECVPTVSPSEVPSQVPRDIPSASPSIGPSVSFKYGDADGQEKSAGVKCEWKVLLCLVLSVVLSWSLL